jgi:hypothetical protein
MVEVEESGCVCFARKRYAVFSTASGTGVWR